MESIFNFLNAGALLGWSTILCILLLQTANSSLTTPLFTTEKLEEEALLSSLIDSAPPIIYALLGLEAICFVEVGRIAIGQLKGNLVLGVVLHMIRMTCLFIVLPDGLSLSSGATNGLQSLLSTLVLYSWSLTEVGRYPMYLFPTSSKARYIRLVLPIFTFPVGAAAEAWGAYNVMMALITGYDHESCPISQKDSLIKIALLGVVIFVNGLLGPTLAYPALLKKGLPVLMGKGEKKKKKSTKQE